MKNIKSIIGLSLLTLSLSVPAFAWTKVADCYTGDAIGDFNVFTDGAGFIVQITSPNEDDAPVEYRTHEAESDSSAYDVSKVLKNLSKGNHQNLVFRTKDSFDFGGATTHAALLSLRLHKKHTFERNSYFAHDSQVLSLACVRSN